MAEKTGGAAPSLVVEVKGLEAGMHDPRGKVSVRLGYALAAHGADHMVAAHDVVFLKQGAYPLERILADRVGAYSVTVVGYIGFVPAGLSFCPLLPQVSLSFTSQDF